MKAEQEHEDGGIRLTLEEKQRQARRNRAIGIAIAGLCLLFYVITVLKMGPAILNRPL
jgi:hypothetical protein